MGGFWSEPGDFPKRAIGPKANQGSDRIQQGSCFIQNTYFITEVPAHKSSFATTRCNDLQTSLEKPLGALGIVLQDAHSDVRSSGAHSGNEAAVLGLRNKRSTSSGGGRGSSGGGCGGTFSSSGRASGLAGSSCGGFRSRCRGSAFRGSAASGSSSSAGGRTGGAGDRLRQVMHTNSTTDLLGGLNGRYIEIEVSGTAIYHAHREWAATTNTWGVL